MSYVAQIIISYWDIKVFTRSIDRSIDRGMSVFLTQRRKIDKLPLLNHILSYWQRKGEVKKKICESACKLGQTDRQENTPADTFKHTDTNETVCDNLEQS